jgi:hypothetical protein
MKTTSELGLFNTTDKVRGFKMEYSPGGLANLVYINQTQLRSFNLVATFEQARDDLVNKLFGGDPKVSEFYTYCSIPSIRPNFYTWKKVFDIVEAMQDGWYKTLFKKFVVTTFRFWDLPVLQTDPRYFDKASKYFGNVLAVRMDGLMHSHAILLLRATGGYTTPALSWSNDGGGHEVTNKPAWYTSPETPSEDDFTQVKVYIASEVGVRDPSLEDTELVVLSGMVPVSPVPSAVRVTPQYTIKSARFVFVGPGTVQITIDASVNDIPASVTTYGPGNHEIDISRLSPLGKIGVQVISSTGLLFMDGYAQPVREISIGNAGYSYFWIPEVVKGQVDVNGSGGGAAVIHKGGEIYLAEKSSSGYMSSKFLQPGIAALNDTATNSTIILGNVNPYLSNDPKVMLAPLSLVELEYPGLMRAKIV